VIIGGGIIGCSTAYHLAKHGKKVIVVERNYVASEGSGRNAGGVRQQGRLSPEVPIVMEAVEIWKTLDKELGIKTEYRQTGNVFLASTEEELKLHEKMAERLRRDGLKDVEVLREDEIIKLIPALKKGMCRGGSYCPTDGMANPIYTTLGYAFAAKRAGAVIKEHTTVEEILTINNRVDGVRTNSGVIKANTVMVAAGSWSPQLGQKLGLEIPITPCRNQIMVTEPLPPLVKPFFLTSVVYCNQTYNGNMFIGNVDPPDFCDSNDANPNENKRIAKNIIRYIPALRHTNIIRAWGGPLDLTPDDMPILGGVKHIQGLVLACGFSGHGFASAPCLGKLMSEYIIYGKTSIPIEEFRYERFKEPRKISNDVYAYGQACGKHREEAIL